MVSNIISYLSISHLQVLDPIWCLLYTLESQTRKERLAQLCHSVRKAFHVTRLAQSVDTCEKSNTLQGCFPNVVSTDVPYPKQTRYPAWEKKCSLLFVNPTPTAVTAAHIKSSQLRIKIDQVSCPANLVTWNVLWFQKSYMKSS